MTAQYETIDYRAINPDDCNIQDVEFDRAVTRFMERFMPGFPLQLLDRDYERWELEPIGDCKVEAYDCDQAGYEVFFVIDAYGERHEFADECDAQDFADEQNQEAEEGRLGFPWAWNWCHYPADNIKDEDLRAAGFTLGLYSDSDGSQWRVCGMDSCGYSFQGAHYSKLYAIVHNRWGCAVDTSAGKRMLTLPEGWDCN